LRPRLFVVAASPRRRARARSPLSSLLRTGKVSTHAVGPAFSLAEREEGRGERRERVGKDDGEGEAEEAYGEGDRGEDRCSDDEPRGRPGGRGGPQGAGQGRAREAGVSRLQGDRARHEEHADSPRGAPPEAAVGGGQAHQLARVVAVGPGQGEAEARGARQLEEVTVVPFEEVWSDD
jgi:hypothetical protein